MRLFLAWDVGQLNQQFFAFSPSSVHLSSSPSRSRWCQTWTKQYICRNTLCSFGRPTRDNNKHHKSRFREVLTKDHRVLKYKLLLFYCTPTIDILDIYLGPIGRKQSLIVWIRRWTSIHRLALNYTKDKRTYLRHFVCFVKANLRGLDGQLKYHNKNISKEVVTVN